MIHPTAEIEPGAEIGDGTRVWHHCHVRTGAKVGADCNLGYGVYVDTGVVIGDRCKLQNRVSVYRGVTIEGGVFVGPHVTFTNDKTPRAITPDGRLLTDADWQAVPTLVQEGASIGAGSVVLAGVTIGRWAMVGAGSVVSRDVPDHGLVKGNPARLAGYVCSCGRTLAAKQQATSNKQQATSNKQQATSNQQQGHYYCRLCDLTYDFPNLGEAS